MIRHPKLGNDFLGSGKSNCVESSKRIFSPTEFKCIIDYREDVVTAASDVRGFEGDQESESQWSENPLEHVAQWIIVVFFEVAGLLVFFEVAGLLHQFF
jgi:hypothetical protein